MQQSAGLQQSDVQQDSPPRMGTLSASASRPARNRVEKRRMTSSNSLSRGERGGAEEGVSNAELNRRERGEKTRRGNVARFECGSIDCVSVDVEQNRHCDRTLVRAFLGSDRGGRRSDRAHALIRAASKLADDVRRRDRRGRAKDAERQEDVE